METMVHYMFRVGAHLDGDLASWFAPLAVVNEPGGEATLEGEVRDQAALHGILAKIRDLNLPLIALRRIAPVEPPYEPDLQAAADA